MTLNKTFRLIHLTVLFLIVSGGLAAESVSDPEEIIRTSNLAAYYAGQDGRAEARMTIRDAQGREQRRQFTILRQDLEDAGDQKFLVVFSRPSDIRGTAYLVEKHVGRDDDRWLYLPGLDLVKRISAGDKRTSFVGAHYFYEDVSGRGIAEDSHELVETTDRYYILTHLPKNSSEVEFSSYMTWIDRATFLPMKIEYTNSSGRIYRRVEVLETDEFQGHATVTRSRVHDLASGGETTIEFRFVAYDVGMPDSVFTERSLRNPPQRWLKRLGSD